MVETLAIAGSKRHRRVEEDLRDAYPWVPVPDDVWDTVRSTPSELAAHSQRQRLSVADLTLVFLVPALITDLTGDGRPRSATRCCSPSRLSYSRRCWSSASWSAAVAGGPG